MPNDNFDADRVTGATFLVEVDGVEIGRFMEVTGLEVEVGVESIEEGGENGYVPQASRADVVAEPRAEARHHPERQLAGVAQQVVGRQDSPARATSSPDRLPRSR